MEEFFLFFFTSHRQLFPSEPWIEEVELIAQCAWNYAYDFFTTL